jgi:hypothetical protein
VHKKGSKSIAQPQTLNERQRTRFGVDWIIQASEKRGGASLEVRMAKEMIAVVQGNSEALKKKEEVHRFAMLNRCALVYVFTPVSDYYVPVKGQCSSGLNDAIEMLVFFAYLF